MQLFYVGRWGVAVWVAVVGCGHTGNGIRSTEDGSSGEDANANGGSVNTGGNRATGGLVLAGGGMMPCGDGHCGGSPSDASSDASTGGNGSGGATSGGAGGSIGDGSSGMGGGDASSGGTSSGTGGAGTGGTTASGYLGCDARPVYEYCQYSSGSYWIASNVMSTCVAIGGTPLVSCPTVGAYGKCTENPGGGYEYVNYFYLANPTYVTDCTSAGGIWQPL